MRKSRKQKTASLAVAKSIKKARRNVATVVRCTIYLKKYPNSKCKCPPIERAFFGLNLSAKRINFEYYKAFKSEIISSPYLAVLLSPKLFMLLSSSKVWGFVLEMETK